MKFCKNLQRVVDISDPEWAPYWTNYKMLKKIIKELPSLVPSEECGSKSGVESSSNQMRNEGESIGLRSESPPYPRSTSTYYQQQGDHTTEIKGSATAASDENDMVNTQKEELGRNPGEIAFFKLLHSEFRKATHFFDKAQQEFTIREERVREGMEIMKRPNSIMVHEKWSMLAKSIFRLYKDLLLLETFAIMTYCSFSKILKKHDKVTGHHTRVAFMSNVVSKSNFASYPQVLEMIARCEEMYEEVSMRLQEEGKSGLYEDERLFISMINRLNEQAIEIEQVPDQGRRSKQGKVPIAAPSLSQPESNEISTLRLLVEDSEARAQGHIVAEDSRSLKRTADPSDTILNPKRGK